VSDETELASQVSRFAQGITETVQSVLGRREISLQASVLGDKFTISTPQGALIVLNAEGEPLLDLKVRYECGWDFPHRYMAVNAAEFHVLAHGNRQPLFRYEFVKRSSDSVPTAHLQIHAHRDAFTWAMTAAGRRSKRAKQRAADTLRVPPSMEEVHFPLGGRRFRPALEDLLQMLVEEFGIEAADGWKQRLESAREGWRRSQVQATIRDAPEIAAAALRDLGYAVTSPAVVPSDNLDALRRY
jgi:hypothetical protein